MTATPTHAGLVGLLALVTSCAGITVETVDDKTDARANGIRYYESAPYLLVYTDGKGGVKTELKFLPDLTRKRSAEPWEFIAGTETTMNFDDGVLTDATSTGDGTLVPKAVIGAIETVAKALASAAVLERQPTEEVPEGHEMPPPELYRIHLGPDGFVEFIPASGGEIVRVELAQEGV